MAVPVLRSMKTEVALDVLLEYGVIKDVARTAVYTKTGRVVPAWAFTNSATGEEFNEPTPKARAIALSLQQNLNIVYDGLTGTPTSSGSRVFWPGDKVPAGTVVMDREGNVMCDKLNERTVRESQPDPLVEVILPNFERTIREAWVRRQAQQEKTRDAQ